MDFPVWPRGGQSRLGIAKKQAPRVHAASQRRSRKFLPNHGRKFTAAARFLVQTCLSCFWADPKRKSPAFFAYHIKMSTPFQGSGEGRRGNKMTLMRKIDRCPTKAEECFLILGILSMGIVMTCLVFGRMLPNQSIVWNEELARHIFMRNHRANLRFCPEERWAYHGRTRACQHFRQRDIRRQVGRGGRRRRRSWSD
jgi:hypothetical protein